GKAIHAGDCRTGGGGSPSLAGRTMEAHHPFPPIRRKSTAVLGLREIDSRDLSEDAGPATEATGIRWDRVTKAISAGDSEGGVPADSLGPGSVPGPRCDAEVGGKA